MVSEAEATIDQAPVDGATSVILSRCFAWGSVAAMLAFLINNYLTNWRGWPGPTTVFSGEMNALASIQLAIYLGAFFIAVGYVMRTREKPLRPDSMVIYGITNYIIRAAFWAVFLLGVTDAVVSFLRVEGFLPDLVGQAMTTDLGRSQFRGLYVHFPCVGLALLIAAFTRGLAFYWLALLVVVAQLLIVFTRFVFSYEQAFMGDLVRFWYAALFLFASAYTLFDEGHVRVDVLYSGFQDRTKGLMNAIGCILLGMSLCWVIVIYGMSSSTTIINSPLLSFEVTQTGFGMYVKYWMAGFLGIFAISMLLQFSGYFLESVADYRGEPGKRKIDGEIAH